MSDSSQGPGWWLASDGRWYPPDQTSNSPAVQSMPPPVQQAVGVARDETFKFHGGAGSFVGTWILATLLMIVTLGLAAPWGYTMWFRWAAENTTIGGRQLRFNGSGGGLFGRWILWTIFVIFTLGIYIFWLVPRFLRWAVSNISFADGGPRPEVAPQ